MDYFSRTRNPTAKASSTDVATITIVVVVAALVIVMLALLIWQIVKNNGKNNNDSSTESLSASAPNARLYGRKKPKSRAMHQHGPVRGARYGVANPRAAEQHEPLYTQPSPMPEQQLNAPNYMPPVLGEKPGVQTSSADQGTYQAATSTTEFQGASANAYSDGNYLQDPGMMTPSTTTDIKGLDTFMPYMGGGIGSKEKDGPVDPETGLPLFTTGKLIRSQLLGGIGSGSFLRQQQDPLSGYRKNVGRLLCGAQRGRRDIEMRRKQFNAARLEGNGNDPVIFNTGEFAYM